MLNKFTRFALTTLLGLAAGAATASGTVYTSESAFLAASGAGLSFESFESPLSVTGTSVTVTDAVVTCSGSVYCPGFFGVRQIGNATDGRQTVYFATPDSITFTFNSAINYFGIDVIDLGTVGATDFTINYVNGTSVLYSGYSGSTGNVLFAGVIDSNPFLSVTFSGTAPNDGIDFDRMQYKAASVPEPGTLALLGLGLAGLGALRRRKH